MNRLAEGGGPDEAIPTRGPQRPALSVREHGQYLSWASFGRLMSGCVAGVGWRQC